MMVSKLSLEENYYIWVAKRKIPIAFSDSCSLTIPLIMMEIPNSEIEDFSCLVRGRCNAIIYLNVKK